MDDDAPPGVPEWVVTYGDMMSLLLTFFIMLVSLSEVKADQKYRAILQAARSSMGYRSSPLSPPGKNFPLNAMHESLHNLKLGSVSNDKEKGSGGVKHKGSPGQELRITRVRQGKSQLSGNAIHFPNGKSDLNSQMIDSIIQTGRKIAGKPHKLEIRAFTDRYVSGIPQTPTQRMGLAYERAQKVMQVLLDKKLKRSRMRIVIYFSNPHLSSEQDQILEKDRVEITTLDEYASSFIGTEKDY